MFLDAPILPILFDIGALSSDIRRSSPRRSGLQELTLVCTSQAVFLWWYKTPFAKPLRGDTVGISNNQSSTYIETKGRGVLERDPLFLPISYKYLRPWTLWVCRLRYRDISRLWSAFIPCSWGVLGHLLSVVYLAQNPQYKHSCIGIATIYIGT